MVMARNENQEQSSDQRGMAAIMVTVILMIVISIIVLGFAQVVRREQQNALDNQLSTQAYYAAESGVNLAQEKIKTKLNTGGALIDKTTCGASPSGPTGYNISSADLVVGQEAEITCLLVSRKLSTLEYQKVDMHSVPMYVKSEAGNINRLYISWQASSGSTTTAGCSSGATTSFSDSWSCPQPLLRLDLVEPGAATNPTAAGNNQYTAFLYPTTSGNNAITAGGASAINSSKDNVIAAKCETTTGVDHPRICTATITGLAAQAYAARVMSVYGESDVTVFASDVGGTRRALVEGQVLIDATAKASDVLKRIQARMSLTTGVPDFAITAGGGGICKRYQTIGGNTTVASGSPAFCSIP